ncbi:cytochrome c biogenesis protein [Microbacterium keratanolyticum]|uniref:Cytochrome c biogenesis protein ResB n=1 Tax=Microbacterium keratanolyticum TaxID=67574 RepID=A0A9W6HQP4_9MICO|nr:cytochrome c biogenesis protein ResB [Microbacterium keratanolyticum]MBM7468259.1 cytochrome c biogenesis protein [Microbacterium keratanolyticum]GLK00334.1 cytochrome c biogenesis protein ResB [Microbacterium keratanolyticum]
MSSSPSEKASKKAAATGTAADPLRPSDHIDSDNDTITSPALGVVGWMRWGWRQLTSMRTALVLLLVLAIAAIPGSIFPQRMADPNGVTQWQSENPDLFPILDAMQMFDVYLSAWFSAIYLLLFLSLIGCVLPRIKHHFKALRTKPPRTPVRLSRLDDFRAVSRTVVADQDASAAASAAIDGAEAQLRSSGYRVVRYDDKRGYSVSAERGYARETGNLLFHLALVGILVTVAVGGSFAYTGQRVVVEGTSFVNTLLDYSSMNRGRFVAEGALAPYRMTLDEFDVTYEPIGTTAAGQAGNFAAHVTIDVPGQEQRTDKVVVNSPITIEGDQIYLLGNGYAPTITVRNADGDVIFRDSVPFLPQDAAMTSLGVVKIPDGLPEQIGLVGFFYPTQVELSTGAFTSAFGDLINPMLTLNVYEGDLGIDDGTPRSVYVLDPSGMEQLTGGETGVDSIELAPGDTAELPGGRGSVTFENESPAGAADYSQSVKRFASLQIHHDASAIWVLGFAVLAVAGLLLAMFVPRRRVWVKATVADDTVSFEYAALARGEDPTLAIAIDDVAAKHGRALDESGHYAPAPDDEPDAAENTETPATTPKVD